MFREMRRFRQQLSPEETVRIFTRNSFGVLAVEGDAGYPYAVPLSYVFADNFLYFHSAKEGHKLDGIKHNSKASFCVVDQDLVVPKEFTTYFASAIAFGSAKIVEEDAEKRRYLELLAEKYSPGDTEGRDREIELTFDNVCVIALEIEHMTGKAAIEIIGNRQK